MLGRRLIVYTYHLALCTRSQKCNNLNFAYNQTNQLEITKIRIYEYLSLQRNKYHVTFT